MLTFGTDHIKKILLQCSGGVKYGEIEVMLYLCKCYVYLSVLFSCVVCIIVMFVCLAFNY